MSSMPTFRLVTPMDQLTPHWDVQAKILKQCSLPREFGPEVLGFAPRSPVLHELRMCRGCEQGSTVIGLLSCLNFKELVCHHPNTLSYPVTALLAAKDLPGENTARETEWLPGHNNNSPNQGITQISPECNSIPACLPDPKGHKSMPLITLTPRQTQAHCHSGHHPFMVSPCSTPAWQTLPFTAADKFQTTCFEQKARVYFKQATKTNIIVWNTLSCPQVKHCLLTVLHSLLAHRTGLPEWLQLRGDQHKECEFFKIMLYANFF